MIRSKLTALLYGILLLGGSQACLATVHIVKSGAVPQLVELYTSQGCSSCPPADRWLNALKRNPGLWQELVPVAFHVDYWNRLGWHDALSQSAFSTRQREYRRSGAVGSVYTPGFVVSGSEWRGYFSKAQLPAVEPREGGTLTIQGDLNRLIIVYLPADGVQGEYIGNVALMGFDLKTRITAGENRRRVLDHDFAVLSFGAGQLRAKNGGWQTSVSLSDTFQPAPRYGIAAWVTSADGRKPLQVLGGWLNAQDILASLE